MKISYRYGQKSRLGVKSVKWWNTCCGCYISLPTILCWTLSSVDWNCLDLVISVWEPPVHSQTQLCLHITHPVQAYILLRTLGGCAAVTLCVPACEERCRFSGAKWWLHSDIFPLLTLETHQLSLSSRDGLLTESQLETVPVFQLLKCGYCLISVLLY